LDDCDGVQKCDLANAFDCVNHELSLIKSQYYSIQGTVANCGSDPVWQTENKKLK